MADHNHIGVTGGGADGNGSAPAPGAVFRALTENPRAQNSPKRSFQLSPQDAGREARPATPGAGALPNFGFRVEFAKTQKKPGFRLKVSQNWTYLRFRGGFAAHNVGFLRHKTHNVPDKTHIAA
jgi:hypothetical protein